MKKNIDIKSFSMEKNLIKEIEIQKEILQKIKLNHSVGLCKNPIEIRFIRKNIAKLKTELNKKNE
ncbi:50S ribosomal protein L29 [Blattabacterium cuenoti]|uniref:50S ribosomal protein L29 n=1 Tax=Blattabacterium cuenoti TaxID=1653831 RepID=UPI00163C8413|nr:50S ribosomal protein L29 [Blattabacterium cuenoti]